jgi:SAM-dependent methyltransferase
MSNSEAGKPASNSRYHATDGAAYDVFLGRWTRRLAEPLLDFADFAPTGRLLEVGCATGSLARAMATRWSQRQVVGADIAEPYVAFARAQPCPPNLSFEVEDAASLSFPDGSFAGVAAQLVLNFVPDPLAALRQMRRVTRTGGRLVAAVWDFRGGLTYQRIFWDTAAGIDPGAGMARDRLFSGPLALPDGLTTLFRAAALDRIERASITIRMDYVDFGDYWRPLCGGQGPVGSYLTSLAPDMRTRIERAVEIAFRSGAPDGERSLTATAWVVKGDVP